MVSAQATIEDARRWVMHAASQGYLNRGSLERPVFKCRCSLLPRGAPHNRDSRTKRSAPCHERSAHRESPLVNRVPEQPLRTASTAPIQGISPLVELLAPHLQLSRQRAHIAVLHPPDSSFFELPAESPSHHHQFQFPLSMKTVPYGRVSFFARTPRSGCPGSPSRFRSSSIG